MTFKPAALQFFRQLARHNEKAWFEAHRSEYEQEVREPMQELIEEMLMRFRSFAPEIGGDPKRSMFRIYRDVRFSKDKSPYKTNAACWFHHRGASRRVGSDGSEGSAGFYFSSRAWRSVDARRWRVDATTSAARQAARYDCREAGALRSNCAGHTEAIRWTRRLGCAEADAAWLS